MSITIAQIKNSKRYQPLVCLTAYSYPIAKIIDPYCDIMLVGDSLGMAIYGADSTLEVTVEMMINHGRAVVKARKHSLVVVDLPYNSYENSKEQALQTCQKIILATGCDAIKLETNSTTPETIKYLVENNIAVVGHVGLLPQHIKEYGGYKYQGKDQKSAAKILLQAKEIEKAGAFAIVIEGVPEQLADEITQALSIPTIGIGASEKCDGQILVIDDMLGLNTDFKPRFVKNYLNLSDSIKLAVQNFASEVRSRSFPGQKHLLKIK